MAQNLLVQRLSSGKINSDLKIIIEDNIGEAIHIHFRLKNGLDFRMDFTTNEFRDFSSFIKQINNQINNRSL